MPQLQIFDPAYFNTVNCPVGLMTTPAGTYCQMMGPYEMPLNGYNTVTMYPGVNNNCPSQARFACGGHFGVGSSFHFKRRRVSERVARVLCLWCIVTPSGLRMTAAHPRTPSVSAELRTVSRSADHQLLRLPCEAQCEPCVRPL